MRAEIELAQRLADRLERLSADSYWAHQASGVRGSLLRCLEVVETGADPLRMEQLRALTQRGYWILEQAALELSDR